MSDLMPRHLLPYVAAKLAAEGHTPLTAPASLFALALHDEGNPPDDRDLAEGRRQGEYGGRYPLNLI